MVKEIQFRRGSTSDHTVGVGFTGALAEVTVDTTNNTLRVHDGSTKGGHELVGVAATQRLTNKDIEATTFTAGVGTITNLTATNLTSANVVVSVASTLGAAYASSLQVTNDAIVNGDLYVTNNVTIGGTTTQLNTQQLLISDPDIVLGIGTTFSSTDLTANHGGIAIASDEGTPLVSLNIVPGEANPSTYKKIMWFKGSTLGAGITDAWLFNYAVGVGSTQVPDGVSFDAGGQFRVKTDGISIPSKLYDSVNAVGAAGSILSSTGSLVEWIANSGITSVTTRVLTTGTTYTPSIYVKYFVVIATGGGGGGGGADTSAGTGAGGGGGGGAGGTAIQVYTSAQMGATATYAIGQAGTAGAATGTNGGAGGNTTFTPAGTGGALTATGGALGTGTGALTGPAARAGGAGGAPTGGAINIDGGSGSYGFGASTVLGVGGRGGASFWGGCGLNGAQSAAGAGVAAGSVGAYGAGGSGASILTNATGAAGSVGEQGVIFILEFAV